MQIIEVLEYDFFQSISNECFPNQKGEKLEEVVIPKRSKKVTIQIEIDDPDKENRILEMLNLK